MCPNQHWRTWRTIEPLPIWAYPIVNEQLALLLLLDGSVLSSHSVTLNTSGPCTPLFLCHLVTLTVLAAPNRPFLLSTNLQLPPKLFLISVVRSPTFTQRKHHVTGFMQMNPRDYWHQRSSHYKIRTALLSKTESTNMKIC